MRYCADRKTAFACRALIPFMLTVTALSTLGCNSASSKSSGEQKAPSRIAIAQDTAPATTTAGPGIDLNCLMNHIQNPPESFRYSFKDDSSNPWQEQADVTPKMIAGSFLNNSLPKPQEFQGTPQEVWSNLMAIGRMSSLFAIVRNTAAVVNEGVEKQVNGYDAVKYSIDTTRPNTPQGLYLDVLGKGGFAKGVVWVIAQGCPVQLSLDEELHSKDGSLLGKAHYQEAMVRK